MTIIPEDNSTNTHFKVLEKQCMIDIETLGTNMTAPVIQIGMVFFTIDGIITSSQLTVDFEEAVRHGKADGDTIKWWLNRPKDAQESLFTNPRPILEVQDVFAKLIEAQNANQYWAHANFDFPILDSMFRSTGRRLPLHHYKCYDLRTLEYAAGHIEWEPRTGVYHNALDDATYQAKHAIKLLKKLNKGIVE
jgi:DNA polymerase III epsilon subunit-like protein